VGSHAGCTSQQGILLWHGTGKAGTLYGTIARRHASQAIICHAAERLVFCSLPAIETLIRFAANPIPCCG
jgi:hypothetical protein